MTSGLLMLSYRPKYYNVYRVLKYNFLLYELEYFLNKLYYTCLFLSGCVYYGGEVIFTKKNSIMELWYRYKY